MSWRDKLQPASFRGAPFKVESHSGQVGGRRVANHEYPGRDIGYAEDMGRKSGVYSFSAYVIGDDYMAARDAVIDACGQEGPAQLIHPYLGSLEVMCTGCTVAESSSEGRMARLDLEFIDAGDETQPTAKTDTNALVSSRADGMRSSATSAFLTEFQPSGLPEWGREEAANEVNQVFGLASKADRLVTAVDAADPEGIAAVVQESLTELDFQEALSVATPLIQPVAASVSTTTRAKVKNLRTAVRDLARRQALASGAESLSATTFDNRTQGVGLFKALDSVLEAEHQISSDNGHHACFAAAQDLRAALVQDSAPKIGAAPEIVNVSLPATSPALAAAYKLSGDISTGTSRAAELVARNKIRHPGFVPGGSVLEVNRG